MLSQKKSTSLRIEMKFSDLPLAAFDAARVTREFANGATAWRRGVALYWPPDRCEKIWSETQITAFMHVASDRCTGAGTRAGDRPAARRSLGLALVRL